MKKKSFSFQGTHGIAFRLGQKAVLEFRDSLANVFTLQGELGAGKTTFAQGFAAGLGVQEKVVSPTFVIIKSYPIPSSERILHHFDCWRVEGSNDLLELGWQKVLGNPANIVLLEWPEQVADLLHIPKTEIVLEQVGQEEREITIQTA